MVSESAGKALSLIHGIDLLKDPSAFTWHSVVTRILLDAGERGDTVTVAAIRNLLARLWDDLPDASDASAAGIAAAKAYWQRADENGAGP